MTGLVHLSLWGAAIGCGVMAGIYFAFSTFVMKSLAAIPRPAGIAAMQSINEVIVSSAFLPLFFGTTLLSTGLLIWSLVRWSAPGTSVVLVGGAVYLVGMFVCTVALNVPLNDALADVDPNGVETGAVWADYLHRWTQWNHLRTVASTVACGLFLMALITRA